MTINFQIFIYWLLKYFKIIFSSGVEAKNSEVRAGEAAAISCVVTGLTQVLESVQWNDADGLAVDEGAGFVIDTGAEDFADNTQTTVLTLPGSATDADATYTCVIRSDEHGQTADATDVKSETFSEL